MKRIRFDYEATFLFVINGYCCTSAIVRDMQGGMDHGIPYRRPPSVSIYVASFATPFK